MSSTFLHFKYEIAFSKFFNLLKRNYEKKKIPNRTEFLGNLRSIIWNNFIKVCIENEPFGLNNLLHHLLPYRYFQYVQRKTSILMRKHIFLTMHHL